MYLMITNKDQTSQRREVDLGTQEEYEITDGHRASPPENLMKSNDLRSTRRWRDEPDKCWMSTIWKNIV